MTLHVPENATVSLAGSDTTATGTVRVFTTRRLSAGEEWSDYAIVATVERDGKTVEREKTITLTGGDDRTVSFDFDAVQVADAR